MISIIVAIAKNRVIGKNGNIPWHLPDDLRHFAKITKGHTVVMGRKTYESIIKRLGNALPERKSVVITSQHNFAAPGCTVLQSVDEAIRRFSSSKDEVFVIGGSKIYEQFLPVTNKLYITEIDMDCDGDTVFPSYDENNWRIFSGEHHSMDEKHACAFDYIKYIKK
jgi:dihydrofolate reductase